MVFTEGGKELFGMDAELYQKKQAKRDEQFELELIAWLEKVTNRQLSSSNVREALRDGTHLCHLLNCAIRPEWVKFVPNPAVGIGEMDNIRVFLQGCKKAGVNATSLFDPHDLLDGNDMGQVMMCLADVARVAQRRQGYIGPYINVNSPRSGNKTPKRNTPTRIGEEPPEDDEGDIASPVVIHIDTSLSSPAKKWAPVKINDGFRGGVMTRDLTSAPPPLLTSPDDLTPDPSVDAPLSPLSWTPSQAGKVHRRNPEATATTPLNPGTSSDDDTAKSRRGCSCNIL